MLSIRLRGSLHLNHPARKLVVSEPGPLADSFDTEMSHTKDENGAAGPAMTPRTVTRSAEVDVKLKRIGELKVKFAGVSKALRPTLLEMAGRTSQKLGHRTHH